MRTKYQFAPDNIEINNDHYEYANDLFRRNGFCVIKNFIDKDDIGYLRNKSLSKKTFSVILPKEKIIYGFFYKNKKSTADKRINEIGIKIHKLRNSILLQPNSDQHLRSYCWRYALDPRDEDKLVDHQLNHTYMRLTRQKESSYFDYHYDSPGEIQAILYLSQYGIDYNEGSLSCIGYDGIKHEIDKNVKIGDLVLLNAYVCKHKVSKISCTPKQEGRLTFFVPIISESHLMFGKTYYFKDNKFKLYFKTPNEFNNFSMPRFTKISFIIYCYFLHLIKLFLRRDKAIDHNHNN